ncbi:MAG TPA: hypothetical protein VLI05_00205 [Candidatus Saccharimonadia bacterium]|nr:hypothetical protein [Candidatus Saccharimonadia bacterium]
MDAQPTPTPNPERRPFGLTPDQLTATGRGEQPSTAGPEAAPQPAAAEAAPRPAPAPQNTGQPPAATAPPQLTANDVAQAIAATPTPAAVAPTVQVPSVASDVDVVEPEWVDAAEQTIAHTAGNPYAEEEAVEGLQVDYLKKRYGHEVKKSEGK